MIEASIIMIIHAHAYGQSVQITTSAHLRTIITPTYMQLGVNVNLIINWTMKIMFLVFSTNFRQ